MNLTAGYTLLHSSVALEKLGGGQGVGSQDGSEPRHHIRCGEKTEEKTSY